MAIKGSGFMYCGALLLLLALHISCARTAGWSDGRSLQVAGDQRGSVDPADDSSEDLEEGAEASSSMHAGERALFQYDPNRDLLDAKSFEGGKGESFVIVDPSDPQKLKGFVSFSVVYSEEAQERGMASQWTAAKRCEGLAKLLNTHTVLRAAVGEPIGFGDSRLLQVPIISLGGVATAPANRTEMRSLVEYIMNGGFILGGLTSEIEHGLQKYAGVVRNIDLRVEDLPLEHPIFRSFFNLIEDSSPGHRGQGGGDIRVTGYFIEDRLVSVGSMPGSWRGRINVVAFALTQKDGIAKQFKSSR